MVVLSLEEDVTRLRIAEELGADCAINVDRCDPREVLQTFGESLGVDRVIDCTGTASQVQYSKHPVMDMAPKLVRPEGVIAKIGRGPNTLINLDTIVDKSITI